MFEIFITVVAAVIVGAIFVKFSRQILNLLLSLVVIVIASIIYIPYYIIRCFAWLIMGCFSDETLEDKIVETYDEMLHVAATPEDLDRGRKTIKSIQTILKKREEKRNDKHVEEMLEEVKWVL